MADVPKTEFDKKVRELKNRPLVVWILIGFAVILGIAQLAGAYEKIASLLFPPSTPPPAPAAQVVQVDCRYLLIPGLSVFGSRDEYLAIKISILDTNLKEENYGKVFRGYNSTAVAAVLRKFQPGGYRIEISSGTYWRPRRPSWAPDWPPLSKFERLVETRAISFDASLGVRAFYLVRPIKVHAFKTIYSVIPIHDDEGYRFMDSNQLVSKPCSELPSGVTWIEKETQPTGS